MKKFYAVTINPHHSGFGMYEAKGESNQEDLYEYNDDLLYDIRNESWIDEIYNVETEELPEGMENISGKIYNEPEEIYGVVAKDGHISYFGIASIEVEE